MSDASTPSDAANGDELRRSIWSELVRASERRQHEWRTPLLATFGLDGAPQARTLVLREAHPETRQLQFYTDRRSQKVAELTRNPVGSLVFWSQHLDWQLRAQVVIRVEVDGPGVDAAWEHVRGSGSAADYLTPHAPGAVLVQTDRNGSEVHQLALLIARVESMDWLEVGRGGHRRARLAETGLQWLVP